ncbi:hypothetical protein HanPSC8_Chr07g0299201 [Helianthus annuus]|nr:hypothetical protein HanPSC8_Chr07g0299201 [Helianthus annuus]
MIKISYWQIFVKVPYLSSSTRFIFTSEWSLAIFFHKYNLSSSHIKASIFFNSAKDFGNFCSPSQPLIAITFRLLSSPICIGSALICEQSDISIELSLCRLPTDSGNSFSFVQQ